MTLTTTDITSGDDTSTDDPKSGTQPLSDFSFGPPTPGTNTTGQELNAALTVTSEMTAVSSTPEPDIEPTDTEVEPQPTPQVPTDESGRRQLFYKITSRATTASIALYATIVVIGLASLVTGVGSAVDARSGPKATDPAAEALPPLPIDSDDDEILVTKNMASERPELPTPDQGVAANTGEENPTPQAVKPAPREEKPRAATETGEETAAEQPVADEPSASTVASTPSTQAPVAPPAETTTTSTSPERLSPAEARALRRQARREERRRNRDER